MAGSIAPLSTRVYRSSWGLFRRWCADSGRVSLPALPETLSLYCVWCVREAGYKLSSVRAHVAAICYEHRVRGAGSPKDDSVRVLLRSLARTLKEKPEGRRALTPGQLAKMSCQLRLAGSAIDLRDRAVLVVGFALGWRGSELARIGVREVSLAARGVRVLQAWSKTDQEGRGRVVGVPAGRRADTCPVRVLRDWLSVRGRWDGPLFCAVRKDGSVCESSISGQVINLMVQRRLRECGERDGGYGSHSLRAGMVTAAAEAGATELVIMQRSGHKSMEMVQRYTRPARAFAADPLAGVL